jgi:hypothetical protein
MTVGTVNWILTKPLANENQFANFEETHGITFPADFKADVLENNNGRPRPNVFDSRNRKELVAKALLSFDTAHPDNIWDTYDYLKERLQNGVMPFMSDQFGNYICFDYRFANNPSIVFWDHELSEANPSKSISLVADGYSEFLDCLYSL